MKHRASFLGTTLSAAFGIAAASAWLVYDPIAAPAGNLLVFLDLLAALLLLASVFVAAGGVVCLWRDSRDAAGLQDPFAKWANSPRGPGFLARFGLRFLHGRALRPGDIVRVRPAAEIRATLDSRGSLDGLPFMAEMEEFSGRTFLVHRRIEKINDMRHKTGLRRMRASVTLTGVRCSGANHGGCEAGCLIIWKEAWLQRVRASADSTAGPPPGQAGPDPRLTIPSANAPADRRYVCQLTELWEASSPMSSFDPRPELRAVTSGNIPLHLFALGLLTRLFNAVQRLRGGAGYPFLPDGPQAGPTPSEDLGLETGDAVIVGKAGRIAGTLVNQRNKGLWFDRDMIRYCGRRAVVERRVHRIIHEATGRLVEMKTPCMMLRDHAATGEFLRFCAQHEHTFWREIWLERDGGQHHG